MARRARQDPRDRRLRRSGDRDRQRTARRRPTPAGSTFTYAFTATNTGNVALAGVVLDDPRCAATLARVEPGLADATFDPGDAWHSTCTVIAPAGPAQVDNVAEVCGSFSAPDVRTVAVCDDDPHTFTVPPPGEEPPVEEPPAEEPPVRTAPGEPSPVPAGAPDRYGFGRHRVVARVRFTAESGTRALRLPLTFRRCAQGTVAPRFTG